MKSIGVPFTDCSSPVGISPASTGVNLFAFSISSWPRMSRSPPVRLKYPWCVRFTGVALSVVATYSIRSSFLFVSRYVTVAVRFPGYPSSPSLLRYVSSTPTASDFHTGLSLQTTLSNPLIPPCRWFSLSLRASEYATPSSVNVPLPIRLPYRPTIAPKYGVVFRYPSRLS